MNRNKGTGIHHLSRRPKGGVFEPKKDCFGRDSFCMPEIRSLAALSITPDEDSRQTYRLKPRDRSVSTGRKVPSA